MRLDDLINHVLLDTSYSEVFFLTLAYFIMLYFGLAPLFIRVCKLLHRIHVLQQITPKTIDSKQIRFEVIHSLKSIFIFSFSAIPIIYLIRTNNITLLPNNAINIFIGVVLLTLWNECYFFIVHRIMHYPFFMKHVHYVHHQSNIPTVYSVYSFHWLEALLLGSVQLSVLPVVPIAPIAIFVYPLVSVLLNYAGHCNYRFGNGKGEGWQLFGTHHNEHHHKGRKNYGFALNIFDLLLSKLKKSPSSK